MPSKTLREHIVNLGIAICAVVIVFLIFTDIGVIPKYITDCTKNEYSIKEACSNVYIATFAIREASSFIDAHNGAFTALATAIMALFTWGLWVSNTRQWKISLELLQLSRSEFISSHRPEIVVHSVTYPIMPITGTADVRVGAYIVFFNKGTTTATITDIRACITRSFIPLPSGMTSLGEQIRASNDRITSGGRDGFHAHTNPDLHLMQEADIQRRNLPHEGAVFLIGIIKYRDDNGLDRETGFCRRLDAVNMRWIDAGSREYEYQY